MSRFSTAKNAARSRISVAQPSRWDRLQEAADCNCDDMESEVLACFLLFGRWNPEYLVPTDKADRLQVRREWIKFTRIFSNLVV